MTDRHRLCPEADEGNVLRCLVQQARFAVDAGIDLIQIREPDLPDAALATIVSEIVSIAEGSSSRVVVNDRFDIALACHAAGVHLRSSSPAASGVRRAVPPGFLIGRSVHSADEAVAAAPDVDYLIAGTVWRSESKPGQSSLLGTRGLAEVVRVVRVPVLAIGGVDVERVEAVAAAGARGAAAIGLFMAARPDADGPCRAIRLDGIAQEVRARFDTSGYH